MFLHSFSIIILLASLPCLYAWKIDRSCQPYINTLRPAVIQAFHNARQAGDTLKMAPWDRNVDRLVGHLFRGSSDKPHHTDLTRVADAFRGIYDDAGTEVTGPPPFSAIEIVFYCNLDRVVQRPDGRWLDQDTSSVFETIKEHDMCKSKAVLAWTWNPDPHRVTVGTAITETFFPAQITFCTWFIEWASKQPIKSIKDFGKLSTWARLGVPMMGSKIGIFSEIDKVALLEKVIVHELTHTAAGGQTDDVHIGNDGPLGFHGLAFGWKYCKRLADKNRAQYFESPLHNADSMALFASGVQLLQGNPPIYIKDDGTLTRDMPRKRSINGTALVDSERFLTMRAEEG